MAAGRTCVHCGLPRLDGAQPPEHPIPLALGSRITTFTTCYECQPRLSQEVENRWMRDFFVQAARVRHPVRNSRTQRTRRAKERTPNTRPLDSALTRHMIHPLGHRVVVRNGRPFYPGSIAQRDDGSYNIVASDETRLRELLAELTNSNEFAESGQQAVGEIERFTPSVAELDFSDAAAEEAMFLGVRMGAKMALSFAGEVFPERWRHSEHADRLRRWLWSERPANDEGDEIGWMPNHDRELPFDADGNHFACFIALSSDEIAVVVRVFSTLGFTVPVAPGVGRLPDRAWISGPTHRGPVATTMNSLVLQSMRRSPLWGQDWRELEGERW